ncbi:hypothetical protein GALMADRAFT_68801 [Galerina marginata CBS 339.88]|uniref:Uncharacterized protein n=1 Tax=Galerina marginata (strain CBS 339.88) TaxID=685588 RepID=A0A067T7A8_GALM3|nr:hypothetical protein GALMADRAFT_68801 [Galerina marginata CBS 339.88]
MSKLDFDKAVEQEEARLRLLHPAPADIPGCISVFDDYLGCSGKLLLSRFFIFYFTISVTGIVIRAQVKSIYRFGERTSCERKFQEFKFCLSLKTMHPEEQRDAWIRRRAEWWANRRLAKSSEDVWDMREKPLVNFPKPITEEMMREAELRT